MPWGIMTLVAQLGKSWSNAWNACCVHTRPLPRESPEMLFRLRIQGKHRGCPPQCTRPSVRRIRWNWVSRSGLWPPAKSLRIWCRASFCSSIQSCTTGALTGVPARSPSRQSPAARGRSTGRSPGPDPSAVRTFRTAFRFSSSCGSDWIFFSTSSRTPHAPCGGIVGQLVEFVGYPARWSAAERPKIFGHVLDPAMSQPRRFQRGKPSSILLRQTFRDTLVSVLDLRLVPLLKDKCHPWPPSCTWNPPFRKHRSRADYHNLLQTPTAI